MIIDIKKMRSFENPKKFYSTLGEYFASKKVRKELFGYPLNNDNNYLWFVAFSSKKEVLGFISIEILKNGIVIHDIYTIPKARKKGVFKALYASLNAYLEKCNTLVSLKIHESLKDFFLNNDFKEIKQNGKWFTLKKDYKNE